MPKILQENILKSTNHVTWGYAKKKVYEMLKSGHLKSVMFIGDLLLLAWALLLW